MGDLRNALADNGTLFCEGGKISDLSDSADRLTLGVKSVIAEAAADETSARVRRSLQANADRGRPHGRLLFGYRRLRDDRTGRPVGQVPNDEQAAVVRRVFAEYNAGSSRQDIANGLNAEGINDRLGKWEPRRIGDLLRNIAYAGRRIHNGEDFAKADWDPLVDMETFLTARRRRQAAGANSTRATKEARLLSGVIRCGVCNAKMYSGAQSARGHAYRCSGDSRCVQRTGVPCDELVTAALLDRLGSPTTMTDYGTTPNQSADVIEATNRVAELEAQLDDLAVQFAAGELSAKMLSKAEQLILPKIAEARKDARQAAVPINLDIPDSGHAQWWDTLDHKLRRQVVGAMIAAVFVHPVGKGRRTFDPTAISIEWAT